MLLTSEDNLRFYIHTIALQRGLYALFWNPCVVENVNFCSWESLVSPLFNCIVGISFYLPKYFWQKDKIFVSTCQPYFFPLIVHISAVHCSLRSLMMRPSIDTNAHTSQWQPIPARTIQYQIWTTSQYQNNRIYSLYFKENFDNL